MRLTKGFIAGLACTLVLGYSSMANAWEACPPIVDVKSPGSNQKTSITFVLDSAAPFPVDIMWIDFKGKMKKYKRLAPGQSYTQSTYVGHEWAAFDGGNCEYFGAQANPTTATIVVD